MLSLNDWDSDWTNHYFSGVKNIENSFAYESIIRHSILLCISQYVLHKVLLILIKQKSEVTQGSWETFWLFMNGHLITKQIVE